MKSPFYRVYVDKELRVDITDSISNFNFEDCVGEDNLIELKAFDDKAMSLLNGPHIITGKKIYVQYGFIGGVISEIHSGRLTDIDTEYEGRITLTIKALDLGTVMKKTTSTKVWKKKKSSEIVTELAAKYDMKVVIDPTTKVWDNLPQGHRNDFEFISYLAHKESDGNFVFFVRNDTMNFVRRGLNKKALYLYTHGEGTELIRFTANHRESTQEAGGISSSMSVVDPETKTVSPYDASNKSEKNSLSLADYKNAYDENGSLVSLHKADNAFDRIGRLGKTIIQPVGSAGEASDMVNAHHKNSKQNVAEASLEVEGNPLIKANEVLTMKNVAKRHEGNWWTVKVSHSIQGSSYTTTCDLSRNSNRKKGDLAGPNVNKTVGTNVDANKVVAHVYNEDGFEVADRTASNKYIAPTD